MMLRKRIYLWGSIQKRGQRRVGLGPRQDAGVAFSRHGGRRGLPPLSPLQHSPIESALPSFSVSKVAPFEREIGFETHKLLGEVRRSEDRRSRLLAWPGHQSRVVHRPLEYFCAFRRGLDPAGSCCSSHWRCLGSMPSGRRARAACCCFVGTTMQRTLCRPGIRHGVVNRDPAGRKRAPRGFQR